MFSDAIEKVAGYTRGIHTITREYGSDIVVPGAATFFLLMNLAKQLHVSMLQF
jgi:hypothetical protein